MTAKPKGGGGHTVCSSLAHVSITYFSSLLQSHFCVHSSKQVLLGPRVVYGVGLAPGSQSVVPGPAALPSLRNLLEQKFLGLSPDLLAQTLSGGSQESVFPQALQATWMWPRLRTSVLGGDGWAYRLQFLGPKSSELIIQTGHVSFLKTEHLPC